jgi:hypothetical protein
MLTHKYNSKKYHGFCNELFLIVVMVLIFFNIVFVPTAFSQRAATNIVFYEENQIKQFTEGQRVKFFGIVNYHTSEGAVAIQNGYYQIINKNTGAIIGSGYTDYKGTFEFIWTAESPSGTKQVNLQAIFPGSGQYPYAESKLYTLEIFKSQKYHDVSIQLQVSKGSRSDSITVLPTVTSFPSGYKVGGTTDFIKIYVNGQQKALVRPNQWSNDIIVGHGTHNVFAESPEIVDYNELDIFRRSTSNTLNINLEKPKAIHDVSIILNWQKGSSDSSIKVKPKVTYDNGITLPYNYVDNYDYDFIEIYVNNQHKASVRPNQLSDNIYIGYGTYNIFAQSPEITDNTSGEVFTSSKSSVQSITLQPPIPGGTGSTITSSTSNTQDPTIFIILGVIAAVGGGVAVAMMKRKKPIPRTVPQDDTQIW